MLGTDHHSQSHHIGQRSKPQLRRSWFAVLLACTMVIYGSLFSALGVHKSEAQQRNPFVLASERVAAKPDVTTKSRALASASPQRLPPANADSADSSHAPKPRTAVQLLGAETNATPIPETSNVRFEPMTVRTPWLQSVTATTHFLEARRILDAAHHEYRVAAYSSAEASTWDALRHLAAALDVSAPSDNVTRSNSAADQLSIAEAAIREAKDFSGKYGTVDSVAIRRLIRCHQTSVLKSILDQDESTPTVTEAIDRYLNEARLRLHPLAAKSVEIAEALDLLAAIGLARYDSQSLPNETALCLRRAALQGQPGNAMLASALGQQLARAGLFDEARWALEHSLAIQQDSQTMLSLLDVLHRSGDEDAAARVRYAAKQQFGDPHAAPRIPEIIQLSPEQFASVSKSVVMGSPVSMDLPTAATSASLASVRLNQSNTPHQTSIPSLPSSNEDALPPEQKPVESPFRLRSLFHRMGGAK